MREMMTVVMMMMTVMTMFLMIRMIFLKKCQRLPL